MEPEEGLEAAFELEPELEDESDVPVDVLAAPVADVSVFVFAADSSGFFEASPSSDAFFLAEGDE